LAAVLVVRRKIRLTVFFLVARGAVTSGGAGGSGLALLAAGAGVTMSDSAGAGAGWSVALSASDVVVADVARADQALDAVFAIDDLGYIEHGSAPPDRPGSTALSPMCADAQSACSGGFTPGAYDGAHARRVCIGGAHGHACMRRNASVTVACA